MGVFVDFDENHVPTVSATFFTRLSGNNFIFCPDPHWQEIVIYWYFGPFWGLWHSERFGAEAGQRVKNDGGKSIFTSRHNTKTAQKLRQQVDNTGCGTMYDTTY